MFECLPLLFFPYYSCRLPLAECWSRSHSNEQLWNLYGDISYIQHLSNSKQSIYIYILWTMASIHLYTIKIYIVYHKYTYHIDHLFHVSTICASLGMYFNWTCHSTYKTIVNIVCQRNVSQRVVRRDCVLEATVKGVKGCQNPNRWYHLWSNKKQLHFKQLHLMTFQKKDIKTPKQIQTIT